MFEDCALTMHPIIAVICYPGRGGRKMGSQGSPIADCTERYLNGTYQILIKLMPVHGNTQCMSGTISLHFMF